MFYWRIMRNTDDASRFDRGTEIAAGTIPYATEELARDASRRERMEHGWTLADGYYDLVEEIDS